MRPGVYLTIITIATVLVLLTACGPVAPTVAPTKPLAAPTLAPKAVVEPTKPVATPTPGVKIKRGGILTSAVAADWQHLDPHTAISSSPGMVALYSSLLRYVFNEKTQQFDFEPALATSWEINPTFAIFRLRKDVTFHDGTPFNAEVAKWNIDRMRTHKESLISIDIPNIRSVDVVDEYTIRLNLSAPPAGLLEMLSDGNEEALFISKAHWEKDGEEGVRSRPVGSGPFKFVEWKTADHMTLERWEKYWENGEDGKPLPYLDRVVMRFIPDQATKAVEMKTGHILHYYSPDPKDVAGLKADPNLQIVTLPWRSDAGYGFFNMMRERWNTNKKLRQAFLYGIDRQAIADTLGFGTARPARWHWGKGMLGYDENIPYFDYQPDKARQLLKEAGYEKGVDVELTARVTGQDQKVAELLQAMWARMGIRAEIRVVAGVTINAVLRSGEFDFSISGKQLGELDPRALNFRFHTEGPKNFAHTKSAELDKCLEDGTNTGDAKERHEIYKRCQQLIYDEASFWLTWEWPYTMVVNKKLKGWVPVYYGHLRLEGAWLDQ